MSEYRRAIDGNKTRSIDIIHGIIEKLSIFRLKSTHREKFYDYFFAKSLVSRYLFDS